MAHPLAGGSAEDREYARFSLHARGCLHRFPGAVNPAGEAAAIHLNRCRWRKPLDRWGKDAVEARTPDTARQHVRNLRAPAALEALQALVSRFAPSWRA